METLSPVYVHLVPGQPQRELERVSPFKAVIVAEESATQEWRFAVCDWLVRNGCRYAMAWGVECDEWHLAVDEAVLRRFDYGKIPDSDFVMTTAHADESLKDALWFAAYTAHHPTLELDQTYIVHIASSEGSAAMLRSFREAQEETFPNEA
jgi:hypothetical protein